MVTGAAAGFLQKLPSLHTIGHNLTLWIGIGLLAACRGDFLRATASACVTLLGAVIAYYLAGTGEPGVVLLWVIITAFAGVFFAVLARNLLQDGRRGGLAFGVYAGLFYGDLVETDGLDADSWWRVFTEPGVMTVPAVVSLVVTLIVLAATNHLPRLRLWWALPGIPLGVLCTVGLPVLLLIL